MTLEIANETDGAVHVALYKGSHSGRQSLPRPGLSRLHHPEGAPSFRFPVIIGFLSGTPSLLKTSFAAIPKIITLFTFFLALLAQISTAARLPNAPRQVNFTARLRQRLLNKR